MTSQSAATPRGGASSDVQGWINRMAQSESGGDYSAVNSLGYTGLLQFGQERLNDFNQANGTSFTLAEFRDSPDIQDRVNVWHVNDIDRAINSRGYLEQGWSLDGLRAVAHLGGIEGMHRFVESGGTYNPSDAYGTSLANYYERFSQEGSAPRPTRGGNVTLQSAREPDPAPEGRPTRREQESVTQAPQATQASTTPRQSPSAQLTEASVQEMATRMAERVIRERDTGGKMSQKEKDALIAEISQDLLEALGVTDA